MWRLGQGANECLKRKLFCFVPQSKTLFFVYFSQFYYVNFPATSFYENRMIRVFTHRMSYCSRVTFIIGRCKSGVVFALISYFFLCFSLLDMEACKIRIRCILSALLTREKKGFVSKQGHRQPCKHSKAWILSLQLQMAIIMDVI